MANGHDHDQATLLAAAPFGLALAPLLGLQAGLVGAGAFAFGGLWLSPDLDTRSKPLHRWGPLRWIWWPYRRFLPHRSVFSHGPLIGMALRLLWLLGCSWMLWELAHGLAPLLGESSVPTTAEMAGNLMQLCRNHPRPLLAAALGLEASVWLHLLLDGDPLPVEWHRRYRNGRRR